MITLLVFSVAAYFMLADIYKATVVYTDEESISLLYSAFIWASVGLAVCVVNFYVRFYYLRKKPMNVDTIPKHNEIDLKPYVPTGKDSTFVEDPEDTIDKASISARLLNVILDMPVDQQLKLLNQLDIWGYSSARQHPRKHWVMPVDLETKDQFFGENIRDISPGGVYIETQTSFTIKQEVKLTFQLPNSSSPIQVFGEIVRSNDRGIGIKFKKTLSI